MNFENFKKTLALGLAAATINDSAEAAVAPKGGLDSITNPIEQVKQILMADYFSDISIKSDMEAIGFVFDAIDENSAEEIQYLKEENIPLDGEIIVDSKYLLITNTKNGRTFNLEPGQKIVQFSGSVEETVITVDLANGQFEQIHVGK